MKPNPAIHRILPALYLLLVLTLSRVAGVVRSVDDDPPERGDVPGWVMITLMSAVLVAALLALAGPALESMFNDAISRVNP
ncbi:hypothetical protein [Arthrobacter sp. H20]|uniref:hypothetical protein n=1 Tax=Arthrobacter sp. H20 TaxID=1267981 RepID=UPI0004BA8A8A|nr:hypothetical protein [Arthrobacter sp. H20]